MLLNNKKGGITILMFVMLIILFIGVLLIFIGGIISVKTYDALNQNIDIGKVNLRNITNDSFGQFNTMYLNNADWWGLALIFGMVFGLFISAYITRNTVPKWWIILDIFIILGAFIFALYFSSVYQDLITALAEADETFLEDYTPKTSMFILNLPIFISVIGAITMFLFHSTIPRKSEERMQRGGILQGV